MLGFQGSAQPSPALGDALNAGYRYLEVKCLGCNTHQTAALDIVRRAKATPIHELERYKRRPPAYLTIETPVTAAAKILFLAAGSSNAIATAVLVTLVHMSDQMHGFLTMGRVIRVKPQ